MPVVWGGTMGLRLHMNASLHHSGHTRPVGMSSSSATIAEHFILSHNSRTVKSSWNKGQRSLSSINIKQDL